MPKCNDARAGVFCGYCYAGVTGRAYFKGHHGWKPHIYSEDLMAKKPLTRATPPSTGQAKPAPTSYSELESKYPILFSFLFDESYEDGSRRTTASVSFFVDKGILKVSLNDKDLRRVAFLAVSGPEEAFSKLEAALDMDALDWRPSRDR